MKILHKKLLIFLLIFCMVLLGLSFIFLKLSIYRVEGTSMLPTYRQNDIIIVAPASPTEITFNDVIAFSPITWKIWKFDLNSPFPLIVHRVMNIKIENGTPWYVTKGDNFPPLQPFIDSAIPYNAVIGKVVFRIPFFVYVTIIIHVVIIFLYFIFRKPQKSNPKTIKNPENDMKLPSKKTLLEERNAPSLVYIPGIYRLSVGDNPFFFKQLAIRFLKNLFYKIRQKIIHTPTYILIPRPRPTNTLRPL